MAATFGDFGEALRGVLWRGLSVVALFGLLVSVVVVTTPMTRAEAQPEPDCVGVFDASFQATVSTEVELDTAIECYNIADTAAGYTISLQADMDYGFGQGAAGIDQSGAGFSLTLEGNGHTITGSGGLLDINIFGVLRVAGGASPVNIVGVVLVATNPSVTSASALDTGGVDTRLLNSAIDGIDRAEFGVFAFDGEVTISNSTITGTDLGVLTEGANATVANSTIVNVDTGVQVFRRDDHASIVNSTISLRPDGNYGVSASGDALVTSSTIVGGEPGTGVVGASATVVSSIVTAGCGAAVPGLNNFVEVGNCRRSLVLTPGSLSALADNGCALPTPLGCVETFALDPGSNAVDGGPSCANSASTDQRGSGFARLVGAECDAGAFELEYVPVFCDGLVVTINLNAIAGLGLGTPGDDVILGTPGADTINGLAGDDTVCAGEGDDTVFAGAGDDRVFGEGGADMIYGATGDDYVSGGFGEDGIFGQGAGDSLYGNGGDDLIRGLGGGDVIDGGSGNDRLHGNGGVDRIWGGPGLDQIWGNRAADFLYGQGTRDIIRGGGGSDVIDGGGGNDDLYGDANADTLTGGPGADTFDGGPGPDTCTDVAGGEAATSC